MTTSNKGLFVAAAVLASPIVWGGQNLIADPEVNITPLSDEFRLVTTARQGEGVVSRFEEDLIWNGCVKLEVKSLGESGNKPRGGKKEKGLCLSSSVEVGGTAASPGFAVRGGDKIRFAFVAKGTAQEVVALFRVWDASGKSRNIKTSVDRFKVAQEWTPVKGEVELPADAVRAALLLQLWYDEYYGPMIYKVGDWVLFDKFDIQRKTYGRDFWHANAAVVPRDGSVELAPFTSEAGGAPKSGTSVRLAADQQALHLTCLCDRIGTKTPYTGTGEWPRFDDHVEIFIGKVGQAGAERHFAVASGGGRWQDGCKDYSTWSSKVERKDGNWQAEVTIPWSVAGFDKMPAEGEPILLQVARYRIVGPDTDPSFERGTHRGYYLWFECSSWNADRGEYGNRDRWGVVFLGSVKPYFDRKLAAFKETEFRQKAQALENSTPTEIWNRLNELEDAERRAILAREPLVMAQVPTSVSAESPFLPDELFDPQPVFKAKAAGNERMFIPVALANMTDEYEEYRVVLSCGSGRPTPLMELPVIRFGLQRADGLAYPEKNIRLLRGVKYRESDTTNHAKRYDPLTPLNAISSVPVPPKEAGLVWIEFDTHGVEPGLYKGELVATPLSAGCCRKASRNDTVLVFDDDSKSVPVEFEVRPFALPEPMEMAVFSYGRANTDYTAEYMNGIGEVLRMFSPYNLSAEFDKDGNLTKGIVKPWADNTLAVLKNNSKKFGNLPRISVCYAFYPHFRGVIAKGAPFKPGSEPYWKAYRAWTKFFDEYLTSRGVERSDYIVELLDEPSPNRGMPVAEAVRAAKEAKLAVPGIRLFITSGVGAYFGKMKDLVDGWVFHYERNFPMARAWAKTGKLTSVYNCNTSMRCSPYRYYRNLPWKAACAGGDFLSIYQFLYQLPAVSIRKAPYGEYVYDTGREILSSIRGENLYLGQCDIRYLKMLEKLAVGDSADAKAARAFAERALQEVTFTRGADINAADDFREAASAHILKLLAK